MSNPPRTFKVVLNEDSTLKDVIHVINTLNIQFQGQRGDPEFKVLEKYLEEVS